MGQNVAVLGVILSFALFVIHVTYHTGKLSARVEELEKWRASIRIDMHEISEQLGSVSTELKRLATLIEERTERRGKTRGVEEFR